jgi:hypothetical protein
MKRTIRQTNETPKPKQINNRNKAQALFLQIPHNMY